MIALMQAARPNGADSQYDRHLLGNRLHSCLVKITDDLRDFRQAHGLRPVSHDLRRSTQAICLTWIYVDP